MDNSDNKKNDKAVPEAECVFQLLIALLEEQEQVKINYELQINRNTDT